MRLRREKGLYYTWDEKFAQLFLLEYDWESGDLDKVSYLFDDMCGRDIVVWNTLASGMAQGNPLSDAWVHLPADIGFTFVITACLHNPTMVAYGKNVHGLVIKYGCEFNTNVGNSLVNMYTIFRKCSMSRVFDDMPKRDVITWTSLVGGYANFGNLVTAHKLFDKVLERNDVSWAVIIAGYVRRGRYNDALRHFNEMLFDDKVKPNEAVLVCVLLAHAHLRALDCGKWVHVYIDKNGVPQSSIILTALIDMYAKWQQDKVTGLRNVMNMGGCEFCPACSWIEVNGVIHEFLAVDKLHPQIEEIHDKLNELLFHDPVSELVMSAEILDPPPKSAESVLDMIPNLLFETVHSYVDDDLCDATTSFFKCFLDACMMSAGVAMVLKEVDVDGIFAMLAFISVGSGDETEMVYPELDGADKDLMVDQQVAALVSLLKVSRLLALIEGDIDWYHNSPVLPEEDGLEIDHSALLSQQHPQLNLEDKVQRKIMFCHHGKVIAEDYLSMAKTTKDGSFYVVAGHLDSVSWSMDQATTHVSCALRRLDSSTTESNTYRRHQLLFQY
ncbi:hypothetical protein NE237_016721 [Protea cynaroides]|uniref:Pentatricopeptide repeat-containing protein n=1 Tax=Protea cynaroides TaxID=273540 RepID=A0A9Q0HII7_9MAGN|nr:hypothetical protein NE237_016721 [Protea cynaroides]